MDKTSRPYKVLLICSHKLTVKFLWLRCQKSYSHRANGICFECGLSAEVRMKKRKTARPQIHQISPRSETKHDLHVVKAAVLKNYLNIQKATSKQTNALCSITQSQWHAWKIQKSMQFTWLICHEIWYWNIGKWREECDEKITNIQCSVKSATGIPAVESFSL